jgi:glycerol-3-phosphate cytidylyltransferase
MIKVITYGTFDLFHRGHYNVLKKAKELGNYLIVGVTSEQYDFERGKLNVQQSLIERIENVKATGLADLIIIEDHMGQKVSDVQKYDIQIFAIGSDWKGSFDYLNEFCNVVYIERTKNISSSQLRIDKFKNKKIGIVGSGRIAKRFTKECMYVSGCFVHGVYSRDKQKAEEFAEFHKLAKYTDDYQELLKEVDLIYIATPHLTHYQFIKDALTQGKHVLCEKPIVLRATELKELFQYAEELDLVIMEGIKTAFCPGFLRLVEITKSNIIGEIKDIRATFTKLEDKNKREFDPKQAGGSINELSSYLLLAMEKIAGPMDNVQFDSIIEVGVDIFTKITGRSKQTFFTGTAGLGVKSEGDLVISGTKGYIYVPAPWWKTQEFEIRFEDSKRNQKFFHKFYGDGLRYEIAEFMRLIQTNKQESLALTKNNMLSIVKVIEKFNKSYLINHSELQAEVVNA